jgi:6-pyruvoyltetrahydropterin/6-carboxytetrahydropterin synthase
MDGNPTAENIARAIFDAAGEQGIPVKGVTFWESPTACATYCG